MKTVYIYVTPEQFKKLQADPDFINVKLPSHDPNEVFREVMGFVNPKRDDSDGVRLTKKGKLRKWFKNTISRIF
jgi:hypothetical protein